MEENFFDFGIRCNKETKEILLESQDKIRELHRKIQCGEIERWKIWKMRNELGDNILRKLSSYAYRNKANEISIGSIELLTRSIGSCDKTIEVIQELRESEIYIYFINEMITTRSKENDMKIGVEISQAIIEFVGELGQIEDSRIVL